MYSSGLPANDLIRSAHYGFRAGMRNGFIRLIVGRPVGGRKEGVSLEQGSLVVENGRLKGSVFPVVEGQTLAIGRSIRSDIQIPDHGVSRIHCRVVMRSGRMAIADLGSSNGTQVNGENIHECELNNGDRISIGGSELSVRLAGGADVGKLKRSSTVSFIQDLETSKDVIRKKYDSNTATIDLGAHESPLLTKTRRNLAAICKMAGVINSEVAMETILAAAADTVLDVTAADRSALVLCDATTGEPEPVATRTGRPDVESEEFAVSRTVLDEALREGNSVISSDALGDERFKAGASVVLQKIHSVMCVPMCADDRIIGAIYVDARSAGKIFTETELGILAAIGQQVGVAIERARLIEDLERLFVGSMHTLIATIEAKDPYTRGHSERVTSYALMIADEMRLSNAERGVIELGGVLHDVGKIAVPEGVLLKPGKLDDAEFEEIRKHPDNGVRIIENMPQMERIVSISDILETVRHHHERYDGKGYPDRLVGEDIPLSSRILAVADTFDAITSDRPYRKGRPADEAMRIIEDCSGTQLMPDAVEAFRNVHVRGGNLSPEGVSWQFRFVGSQAKNGSTDKVRSVK